MKFLTLNLLYLIIQCQPNQHQRNSDDYVSEQNSYNYEQESYSDLIQQNKEETNFSQFLTTILIMGLMTFFLSKIFQSKKQTNIDRNSNKNNLDELNQRLNSIAQKLQEVNLELTYTFNGQWVQQKVEKVSVSQNIDTLTFHLKGSDCYGSWVQVGVINISQINQVETFSRKMYENAQLNDGDVLIYYGQFDDQIQSFKGHWYYLESKEKGEWLLKLQC